MATPREIRRLAFSALFQFDARGDGEPDLILAGLHEMAEAIGAAATDREIERAFAIAQAAYQDRAHADRVTAELAPGWPAHRQPAVDRAILRLAHYEMNAGVTAPKVAVNEAVELAKQYGTERSPAFVNGVLDKVLKRVLAGARDTAVHSEQSTSDEPSTTE